MLRRSAELKDPGKHDLSGAESLRRKIEFVYRGSDPEESHVLNIHQKLLPSHRCGEGVVATLNRHESSSPNEDRLKVDLESIKSSYRVPRSHDAAIELHNITKNFWAVLTTCFPSADRTIIESVVNALLIILKNSTEENDTLLHLKQEIPLPMEEMRSWIEGYIAVYITNDKDATDNCPGRNPSSRSIPNDCRELERPYPTVLIKRKNSSGMIIES